MTASTMFRYFWQYTRCDFCLRQGTVLTYQQNPLTLNMLIVLPIQLILFKSYRYHRDVSKWGLQAFNITSTEWYYWSDCTAEFQKPWQSLSQHCFSLRPSRKRVNAGLCPWGSCFQEQRISISQRLGRPPTMSKTKKQFSTWFHSE